VQVLKIDLATRSTRVKLVRQTTSTIKKWTTNNLQNKQETEHIYHQAGIEKAVYAYPDEAIVEMEPDEAGGDAGVVSDGVRHHLLDQRLGVGAAGVVEPHLQLAAGHRRQLEAQQRQRDDRRHQHSTIHLLACCKHGHDYCLSSLTGSRIYIC
jgi:hypothetical protein